MAEMAIQTERIDDIPLLVKQQQQMGIPEVLDKVIGRHGNRQGVSIGGMLTVWLGYILSEADHRMSEVEPWAAQRLETLSRLLPGVHLKDFTDDRLADGLCYLSDDENWEAIEHQLGQRLVRVYDLTSGTLRLDSTTAAVYHNAEGNTLFRHGHSKDRRPDLAQFKVMLASLDPLGMPVATLVVAGNQDDDGLYVPAIADARPVVGQGGRLYIGDAKMGARNTRAFIQADGDHYLTPLAQTGTVPEQLLRLLEPVWQGTRRLQRIYTPSPEDGGVAAAGSQLLALGYETTREQRARLNGQFIVWTERVLVIYSPALARKARRGLAERLQRAEQALLALTPPRGRGKRQWDDAEALQVAGEAILNKHRVQGLLQVQYHKEVARCPRRQYRDRPARTEERIRYVIQVARHRVAIAAARRQLGWRLYVTNAPSETLSLAEAVWAYRGAAHIERDFRRLKGRPLGIRPLYIRREKHAKGMVRLLSLALRVLTVVEHVVRQQLHKAGETLSGLYAGNPTRRTAHPTTERLLKAFRGVTLTIVHLPDQTIRHVTPLSDLQQRILALLDLPASFYDDLTSPFDRIPP
jgi:transposase